MDLDELKIHIEKRYSECSRRSQGLSYGSFYDGYMDCYNTLKQVILGNEEETTELKAELNKAKEWHYPSKGEYPKEGTECLCNIRPKLDESEMLFGNQDFRGVLYYVKNKFLLDKEDYGLINDTSDFTELVIAWKEIVPQRRVNK